VKDSFCLEHSLLGVQKCLPLGIYLAMEGVNDVLNGISFRPKDGRRIHFIPCVPELCLADQTAILRLVDDVIKDWMASDTESAMTSFGSDNPGLFD
jgi:hypothetical protein